MSETFPSSRICAECGRTFKPSSGHLRCPKCRQHDQKAVCACGKPMNKESVQCFDCRSVAREKNGHWKGGQTKHHAGYVMVRVPDHPRARNNGGYVFEHILVMEDDLGRTLLPGETVHHLNGVKDDNRLENLELWTRPQPAGVRAADLARWAVEVLDLYGHLLSERHSSNNAPSSDDALLELAGNDPASDG